jgi:ubiquinone/menaquinone biosynthesis C-methylase UbiE
MKKQVLYGNLAKYYDLIHINKNYEEEVTKLNKIISKYKKSDGNELLEVACGSGKHIKYFKNNFICTGMDINIGILNVAKEKFPDVIFKKGNMINFNLNKKFDVITCLFSSIGYIKKYSNVRKTIFNFSKHLKKGGIIIIEPWITKKDYHSGSPHMDNYADKDIKISRQVVSRAKDNRSILDMHYLVAERNKKVKYITDRHEMLLFEKSIFIKYMKEAGFEVTYLTKEFSRGLLIGVKK